MKYQEIFIHTLFLIPLFRLCCQLDRLEKQKKTKTQGHKAFSPPSPQHLSLAEVCSDQVGWEWG